jgi:hypothetical protein
MDYIHGTDSMYREMQGLKWAKKWGFIPTLVPMTKEEKEKSPHYQPPEKRFKFE